MLINLHTRLIALVLSALLVRSAHAQPTDLPPLTSPQAHFSAKDFVQSSTTAIAQTETIIVRHKEPCVLQEVAASGGPRALEELSRNPTTPRARHLRTRVKSAFEKIDKEHRQFLAESATDPTLYASISKARTHHLKNAINASIIGGAPRGTMQRLRALGYTVEPALEARSLLSASVPAIGASAVWGELRDSLGRPITGRGVRVGVIDTGIDYTHADFGSCSRAQFAAGGCTKIQGGYDWVDNDSDPIDENLHGTHVASIIAANSTTKGVAPDATLYALRVLDASGSGSSSNIIRAIEWATDPNGDGDLSDHLDIINLSLGSTLGTPDSADSVAADNAAAAGVVVVAAAGNAGPEFGTIGSPGAARRVLTVGASRLDGTVADFSSRGPVRSGELLIAKPDILAPGVAICAGLLTGLNRPTCTDQEHTALSGTSMAAPHVAGVAALIKQARPSIAPGDLKSLIKGTANPLVDTQGNPLSAFEQGAGVVAALPAARYALSERTPPVASISTAGTVYEDLVQVVGSAGGSDFEKYQVFLQPVPGGLEHLIGEGTSAVTEAELSSLDVGGLTSGDYEITLVVYADQQRIETSSIITVSHLAISSPVNPKSTTAPTQQVYGSSDTINIVGRVNGRGLLNFSLSICWDFSDVNGCSQDALTPIPNTSSSILHGTLASLDVTKLPVQRRGLYSLRLLANYNQRPSEILTQDFYLDPFMVRGYNPALRCDNDTPCSDIGQQPLLADINSDGHPETIYSLSRHLYVVDQYGSPLPGWPRATDHSLLTPPSVGDLNGDGKPELVVQGYDYFSNTRIRGAIYAFDASGTPLAGWPTRFDLNPSLMRRYAGDFITLADIDGDGASEVLLSPFECLKANGTSCPEWSMPPSAVIPDSYRMFGGLAVGDLDNDGDNEIISTLTDWSRWTRTGEERSIILIQDARGTVIASKEVHSLIPTGPVITDVNGDGVREFATYDRSNVTGNVSVVVRDSSASPLPGWTASIPNAILGDVAFSASFIAADVDGNGSSEIAIQSDIDTRVIFYRDGAATVRRPDDYRLSGFGSLVAANVDSDPAAELLLVSRYYPLPLSSQTNEPDPRGGLLALVAVNDKLTLENGFPLLVPDSSGYLYPLAVGDIDGDGENDISYPANGEILGFRTGGCANVSEPWPLERSAPDRRAADSSGPLCSTGSQIFGDCARHSDNDLIDDCQDRCPLTDRLQPHAICGCSTATDDPDGDGTLSCLDLCPTDPLKQAPGVCGCSQIENDSNGDGEIDCGTSVAQLTRPTAKPRVVKRRPRYLKVAAPIPSDSSRADRTVEVCLKKRRGRTRCRATDQGIVTFKPSPGYYTAYYTWRYSSGAVFQSPHIQTRITGSPTQAAGRTRQLR